MDNILQTTTLIDCNRVLSEEVIGGNETETSLFTNKLTTPLTVKAGDQISLHSAYINQRGAGSDIIEFRGREQNDKVSLVNTSLIFTNASQNVQPFNFQTVNVSEITTEKTLKDNEANITFNYYKTSNGESYYFLPRKFLTKIYDKTDTTTYLQNWTFSDSFDEGMCFSASSASDRYCQADYYLDKSIQPDTSTLETMKPFNDNSRFTIFIKDDTQFGVLSSGSFTSNHDPALQGFTRYKETKTLTVDRGFDTPSNIASSLTNQLKKLINNDSGIIKPDNNIIFKDVNMFPNLESETYKLFACANEESFRKDCYTNYFHSVSDPTPSDPYVEADAIDYDSSFISIGVKRPELFENGRKIKNVYDPKTQNPFEHPWEVLTEIDISASNQPILVTDQAFASQGDDKYQMDQLLLDLSNLFKSQEKYPEIFNYSYDTNLSVDNTRLLHINSSFLTGTILGSDNYQIDTNTSETDFTSFPLFIKYDKSQENNALNTGADRVTFSDLLYGFGIKYLHTDDKYYLAFKINTTLRPEMFNASGKITTSRHLAWDWHFNAYSTLALNLYTGYLSLNPEKVQENSEYFDEYGIRDTILETSRTIRQCYIGAFDPLITFNNVEERFSISRLHTPEFLSNFYNSGRQASNGDVAIPVIEGGSEVYKINKYLSQFNFCPNMKPYEIALQQYDHNNFRLVNKNIIRNKIYDSQGGIFIDNKNLTEKEWNKSLLNILGYSYKQFNSTDLTINTQTRFSNLVVNSDIITTNGLVNTANILDFTRSIYGAKMYTNQVALTGVPAAESAGVAEFDLPPNIEEVVNSTEIFADDLPKKMASSHYVIRSDILDQSNYCNSISKFPIIGVCPRSNQFGDYYVTEEDQIIFTVTKARTITDITTEIVNPAGEKVTADRESSVIYKVIKNINLNLDFNENNK